MEELKKMTFKEKDALLRSIVREYHKAKIQLKVLEDKEFYPTNQYNMVVQESKPRYGGLEHMIMNHIEKKEALRSLIGLVDDVFHSLDFDEQQIIENDFLNPVQREWWQQFYSRSTFYRIKKKAVDEMLYYLIR
ncbi:MAG: hypothetical protein KHY88_01075 [Erysipelotrichaceae bacterium]|nr:hypothetical protein [Erysipelotrichaceae bacterium]